MSDTTQNTPAPLIVPTITLSRIGCDPRAAVANTKAGEAPKEVCVARIAGHATGTGVDTDKTGQVYVHAAGQFAATNMQTGAQYRAGKLYLPGGFHEMVVSEIEKTRESGAPVEFAIEIWAVSADNPIGYSYVGRPLFAPAKADPLMQLAARMNEAPIPASLGRTRPAPAIEQKKAG